MIRSGLISGYRPGLLLWGLLLSLFLFPAASPDASDEARTFLEGISAYQEGEYERAVTLFTGLVRKGIENGKLYYNLGNAHLKNGDLGDAILWYERALNLIPDDPDLHFNVEYARSLVKDVPEKEGMQPLRVLFFWNDLLGPKTIQWTAILLNLLLWLLLAIRLVRGKRPLKGGVHLLLIVSLIFTATALYGYTGRGTGESGIILPEAVSVRSGLSKSATELFLLHAGTKVKIQKEKEGFYRIAFSESKIGWVSASEVGAI